MVTFKLYSDKIPRGWAPTTRWLEATRPAGQTRFGNHLTEFSWCEKEALWMISRGIEAMVCARGGKVAVIRKDWRR